MINYQPANKHISKAAKYTLKSGEITPASQDRQHISLEDIDGSHTFGTMAIPEGGKQASLDYQGDSRKFHLGFANCKTESDALAWCDKYGLPFSSTMPKWYNGYPTERENAPLEIIKTADFLFWAKIADWLIEASQRIKNDNDIQPVTAEVSTALYEMTGFSTAEDIHKASSPFGRVIDSATGKPACSDEERIFRKILNEGIRCASPYLHRHSFRAAPAWSFNTTNCMQLIFLNILADATDGSNGNKNRRCSHCGNWFNASWPTTLYCSDPACSRARVAARKREQRGREKQTTTSKKGG